MRLVAALLRGTFWFALCVCVTHWNCVFCDCVPRLRSVFLYCVCVSRYPFVSASCVCILHFPTASPVTQSLCSLRDFFRCSLHRFLRSTVGFIPTRRTLSLTGRSVVALTHCSVSALSLLSYLYRLADLMARTPQIAPCLTWILSSLEFVLCLVRSGVHHRMRRGKLQYLVHWKGYNSEDDSWEPASVIFQDAPSVVSQFHDDHPSAVRHIQIQQTVLSVQKLSENARLPTSGSEFAAGRDLYSAAFVEIPAKTRSLVPMDIAIAIPRGHYARIAPRSGMALKNSIDVAAGVIDEDYRRPIGVLLINNSNSNYSISPGDRIAQLILEQCSIPIVIETSSLPPSSRDTSGFGSTGI